MIEIFAVKEVGDLEGVFSLIEEEALELDIDFSKVSKDKCLAAFMHCVNSGVVLLAKRDASVVGILALLSQEVWWSEEVATVCNLMFYVSKSARNSTISFRLLNKAKELVKVAGLELNIFVDSNEDLDRKHEFFKRLSFNHRGGTYRFN